MKKLFAIILALAMIMSLAACGSTAAPDPNAGTYTGTYATMYGLRIDMKEAYADGFDIVLKDGGKCIMIIGSKSGSGKWTLDGTAFVATVQGEEYKGTLSNGVITLTDVQGSGVDLIFINNEFQGAAQAAASGSVDGNELIAALSGDVDLDWWQGDWYGWWIIREGTGEYAGSDGSWWWDIVGRITDNGDGTAELMLWDEDSDDDEYIAYATLSFEGTSDGKGIARGTGCSFYAVPCNDWSIDPAASTLNGDPADNVLEINGYYADDSGDFYFDIYLRPWGTVWNDVDEDDLPYYYNDWYLPLIQQGVTTAPNAIG